MDAKKKLIVAPAEKYMLWTSPSGGTYRVSNRGTIHRYMNSTGEWKVTGLSKQSSGYRRFAGRCKSERWTRLVHRVVAELFIPNPEGLPEVDHIDRDRSNNRVENLRWVSHQQNAQNQLGRGCEKRGSRWRASIRVGGKNTRLGTFDTEEEAHAAYLAAKRVYHPFFVGEQKSVE